MTQTTSPSLRDLEYHSAFVDRHIGPNDAEIETMLKLLGHGSLDAMTDAIVPGKIKSPAPLALPAAITEVEALAKIAVEAEQRWPLLRLEILHRVGALEPGEPIVFVGTASAHREAAFEACNFVMDYLKTRAPFWKKEHGSTGASWVEGRASDQQAAQRWQDEAPS